MQTVKKSNQRGVNKSAWIRAQPATMRTKDVISAAKKEGIQLTPSNVYVARYEAKRRQDRRPNGARIAASQVEQDLRMEFQRLAVRIGTDAAQQLLDGIQRGEFTQFLN